VGYYDANNGVFFDLNGTSQGATGYMAVTVRSNVSGSVVDTAVLSTSWSIDKFDGTGPSGLTVNWAYPQQFVIDLQWLGVGTVRFGLRLAGTLYYCHQVNYPNTSFTPPYINTATLPFHWAIYNTALTGSSTSIYAVCGVVISEGGNQYPASYQFSVNNGVSAVTAGTATPILSISPKTTFNSIRNKIFNVLQSVEILSGGGENCLWQLIYNGTLSGAAFSSVSTNSGMNYDVSAASISGGTVVASGYIIGGAKSDNIIVPPNAVAKLPFTLDITGSVPDNYTLVVTSFTSTTAINAAISWTEAR
jgi:hypothetical protein